MPQDGQGERRCQQTASNRCTPHPANSRRRAHRKTINDKLSSSFEQPQQIPIAIRAYEFVGAVNFGHRKESALGDQTILSFHEGLFLHEQLLAGSVPLIFRNHIEEVANGFAHRRSRDSGTFLSRHILLR